MGNCIFEMLKNVKDITKMWIMQNNLLLTFKFSTNNFHGFGDMRVCKNDNKRKTDR